MEAVGVRYTSATAALRARERRRLMAAAAKQRRLDTLASVSGGAGDHEDDEDMAAALASDPGVQLAAAALGGMGSGRSTRSDAGSTASGLTGAGLSEDEDDGSDWGDESTLTGDVGSGDRNIFGTGDDDGEDEEDDAMSRQKEAVASALEAGNVSAAVAAAEAVRQRYLPTSEASAHLQLLWENDAHILRRVFLPVTATINAATGEATTSLQRSRSRNLSASATAALRPGRLAVTGAEADALCSGGWRHFFLRVVAVPPARFRPPQMLGDAAYEHAQNVYLTRIMKASDTLMDLGFGTALPPAPAAGAAAAAGADGAAAPAITTGYPAPKLFSGVDLKRAIATWMDLQNNVNGLLDSAKASNSKGQTMPNGIRQLLEKKEGMFRKNMMGKRVNFAARSVISPDPYLRTDQVGVPVRFAKVLTFKQPVTAFNVTLLRQLVVNGPYEWPGANFIEMEDGTVVDLATRTRAQREALAKQLLGAASVVGLVGGGASAAGGAASSLAGAGISVTGGASALAGAPPIAGEADTATAIASATAGAPGGVGVKRVYRHLLDDDIVLMNRQPTLHKPSIMAHRARVMRHWSTQQTIRFHYANCKTYNADFDGDEMNMHMPQDDIARAEAYTIVANPFQYLAPTSGAPLRGLIQDHNSVSVILTKRDTFLTRDQYCQLVFSALQALPQYGVGNGVSGGDGAFGVDTGASAGARDILLLPPTVVKPRPLWTGKQVFSTILHALSSHLPASARLLHMDAKTKIDNGLWGEAAGRKDVIPVGEANLTIRGNDMLTGVIDKNSLGNTSHGLTHCVYETYGPHAAGALLSATGRLLTVYLQWAAVTCGMDDLILKPEADVTRAGLIRQGLVAGAQAAAKFAGVTAPGYNPATLAEASAASAGGTRAINPPGTPQWMAHVRKSLRARLKGGAAGADATGVAAVAVATDLDNTVKGAVAETHSAIIKSCLSTGLGKPFPRNQFSLMVASGAKGSQINHAMIAVGLGQQELEGRRVPLLTSGKSLPCFPSYDPNPRAGGYISDRFLTGLRPADYYFHSMSGREGLVDTAVKTSRSGYLQRCLVKHLESLRVHYDYSVRDADGGIVQTTYGEDGLDTMQTAFLSGADDKLTFLARNALALSQQYGIGTPNFARATGGMQVEATQALVSAVLASRAAHTPAGVPEADGAALALPLAHGSSSSAGAASGASAKKSKSTVSPLAVPSSAKVAGAVPVPVADTLSRGLAKGDAVHIRMPATLPPGATATVVYGAGEQEEKVDAAALHPALRAAICGPRSEASVASSASAASAAVSSLRRVPASITLDGRKLFPSLSLPGASEAAQAQLHAADAVVAGASGTVSSRFLEATITKVRPGEEGGVTTVDARVLVSVPLPACLDKAVQDASSTLAQSALVPLPSTAATSDATITQYVTVAIVFSKLPVQLAMLPAAAFAGGAAAAADVAHALLLVRPAAADPLLSSVTPSRHLGAMGEALLQRVASYIARNPNHALKPALGKQGAPGAGPATAASLISASAFNLLMAVKAQRALVHPGEPVGVLAAQGVGEPSTQMTLNTFHLAGGGGLNVTLGIPRLREIVMTASANIKTPSMQLPLPVELEKALGSHETARAYATAVARKLSPLPLSDLLACDRPDGGIVVTENLRPLGTTGGSAGPWVREYAVRLYFTDVNAISEAFGLSWSAIASTVSTVFAPKLLGIIDADNRKAARAGSGAKPASAKPTASAENAIYGAGEGPEDDVAALADAIGVSKASAGGGRKRKRAADADADEDGDEAGAEDEEPSSSRSKKRGAGKAGRKGAAASNDDDASDASDEEDGDDEAGEDDGTLRVGTRKQMRGYDDVDEGAEDDDEEDGGNDDDADDDEDDGKVAASAAKKGTKRRRAESDEDEAEAAASDADGDEAMSAAAAAPAKRSSAGKLRPSKLAKGNADSAASTAAALANSKDVTVVVPPESVGRDARFGGILACRTGLEPSLTRDSPHAQYARTSPALRGRPADPWVQLTIVLPASARKVLMLASAERAVTASLVRSTPGITRAVVTKARLTRNGDERTIVVTEGVNFGAVWALAATMRAGEVPPPASVSVATAAAIARMPLVDAPCIGSNDVAAFLRIYGVEAARGSIVKEMRGIFDAYGIGVDIRHLYLIADYMTQGGAYRAMNRAGMDAHGSPYMKMSFETTMQFMLKALLNGEHERMVSPSARIVMGRVVDSGTGAFDLWSPASVMEA